MKTKQQEKLQKVDSEDLIVKDDDLDEDDLTCPICLDILHRPRVLPCGHSFCLLCLQNYVNTCRMKFACPSCRGDVQVPSTGVSGLPQDNSLSEAAHRIRQRLLGRLTCHVCHISTNVSTCLHCQLEWCSNCSEVHRSEVIKGINKLHGHLDKVKDYINCHEVEELLEIKKDWDESLSQLSSKMNTLLSSQNINISVLSQLYADLLKLLKSPLLPNEAKSLWKREIYSKSDLPILHQEQSEELEVDDDLPHSDHGILYRKKSAYVRQKWNHNLVNRMSGVAYSLTTPNIYVTGSNACKIIVLNPDGKYITSWGTRGHGEGQFLCPTGIAFSHVAEELLITDKWRHCICVFDLNGNFIRQLGRRGKGYGHFISPEGIATDRNGRIYVADTCNNRIQILDRDGVFLQELGVISSIILNDGRRYIKSELHEPTGVAVTPDGSKIYVADAGNNRIKVFDGVTGQRLLVLGSRGLNKGQFDSPECVAVDPSGYIVVGDSGNGRLQVFSPDGRFIRYFGTKANNRHGEIGWVASLALSKNYDILVTDFKNNVISVY